MSEFGEGFDHAIKLVHWIVNYKRENNDDDLRSILFWLSYIKPETDIEDLIFEFGVDDV
jgi:hypothetical protein